MATFADLVKYQKSQGKGVIGSLSGAIGQATLQKIDPRNYLFNRRGTLASLFPGLKGYQAKTSSEKLSGGAGGGFSTGQVEVITNKLDQLSAEMSVVAKNSMSFPMMARDMNVMRQNIVKLVKAQGVKPAQRADAFFMRAGEREKAYESQFGKKPLLSPTPVKQQTEQPSLLQTLVTTLGSVITTGLTSLATVINGSLTTLGSVIKGALDLLGKMILARSIANQMPTPGGDIPDADKKGKEGKGKAGGAGKTAGRAAMGARLLTGAGLMLYSSPVGEGSDKVPNQSTSPSPAGFDYDKYKELVAKQESGNNYKIDNKVGFLGKYQFGAQALETFGYLKKGSSKGNNNAVYDPNNWTGKDGMKNKDDFLNNLQVQEDLMKKYTKMNMVGLDKAGVMKGVEGDGAAISSRLYAAHHGGVGGAKALFLEGKDTKDIYLPNASVGKSATNMASLYSSGSAPSGAEISSGSVAIAANQNLPNNGTTQINDNKVINQMAGGGSGAGAQASAYDNDMMRYLLRPVS
jgi:hypothetical protein